ncbi:MAG: hypothetical protein JXX14_17815 [Deltaproteobacteria bacterium]|nr:hypothetical protein [Deltaproteobacteria bacterium]
MRIARLNVMIPDCPRCGYPIVVDGFTDTVTCESCHNVISIHHDQWRHLFHSVYEDTHETYDATPHHLRIQIPGTFEIRCEGAGLATMPCAGCAENLDVQHVIPGATELICHHCGHRHPLQGLPEKTQSDNAVYAIHSLSVSQKPNLSQLTPIMMNCPNCSATLKISGNNERVTACEYCNGEFLIPDPLWKKLHPVKTAAPWYVLYKHPPLLSPQELAEKKRQDDALAAERDAKKRKADAQNNRERKINAIKLRITREQSSFSAGTWWGYGILAFIGIFAIGFPIIFIIPLSKLVGSLFCDGVVDVHVDSGDYSFICVQNDVSKNFDIFALYGLFIGIAVLCIPWTLYLPIRYARYRATVAQLVLEMNDLKATLHSKK